jgi:cation transporter-like permease
MSTTTSNTGLGASIAGPRTSIINVIVIVIIVAILAVIVIDGFVVNYLIQGGNKTLTDTLAIVGIIVTIVILFVLIYVAFVLGRKARTCQ